MKVGCSARPLVLFYKYNNKHPRIISGFPLGLEKWEGIFQAGKSPEILNRLEKSGKITQKAGKIREFLVIFKLTVYYLLKNTEKVGEFCRSRKVILILLLITQFWHLKITESH